MFKLTVTLLLTTFLSSCAKPKYINKSSDNTDSSNAQETKVDCSITFNKSGVCLTWQWQKRPTAQEPGSLIFKTYRLNSLDQTPVEIDMNPIPQVVLWMPSMGHGSTPTHTTQADVGTYLTSNVFFVMPGEWDIKFQIKNGSEITDETQVSITF